MLPARRLVNVALGLLRGGLDAQVLEWHGYALDDAGSPLGEFVVVQLDSEEIDEDALEQDLDAAIVTLRVSSTSGSPAARDALHLAVREVMAADDRFEFSGTTFPAPEVGASALFEATSTYRARVFHGLRSPADTR